MLYFLIQNFSDNKSQHQHRTPLSTTEQQNNKPESEQQDGLFNKSALVEQDQTNQQHGAGNQHLRPDQSVCHVRPTDSEDEDIILELQSILGGSQEIVTV